MKRGKPPDRSPKHASLAPRLGSRPSRFEGQSKNVQRKRAARWVRDAVPHTTHACLVRLRSILLVSIEPLPSKGVVQRILSMSKNESYNATTYITMCARRFAIFPPDYVGRVIRR